MTALEGSDRQPPQQHAVDLKNPNRDLKLALVNELETTLVADMDRLDLKMITSAIRELREAFTTFAPYRKQRKVTVFGSARIPPGDSRYVLAHELGAAFAQRGWLVITGGGPGIMDAATSGAGPQNAFGINIRLPHEQEAAPGLDESGHLIEMKYFFTRKVLMIKESSAFVSMPGGLGTLDETFELLTLLQTGKAQLAPLVLLEPGGGDYFGPLLEFLTDVLVPQGLVSAPDLNLYRRCWSVAQAVKEVTTFYHNYDSARIVGQKLILRLKRLPQPSLLNALNRDFADILRSGAIEPIEPTAWEVREDDLLSLKRLAMNFDQHSLGRLRMMIDRLNEV
ncbi:TIGR00730 family Rossman fold protein [Ferrimicrobium sp.]|uniref:LOG family protein n=1 Tax=Ferrimicrobium sp. TaxID=2926050 RepID=UPI002618B3E6|nr:TIGR00730 family Rossman fold protein [Ferrimicrobium sp.]